MSEEQADIAMPPLTVAPRFFIEVRTPEGLIWRQAVTRPLVIGRLPESDLFLPSPKVSRRHAEISIDDLGSLQIRDLGSSNRVYVNGAEVAQRQLEHHDAISLGDVSLIVHINAQRGGAGPTLSGASIMLDPELAVTVDASEPSPHRMLSDHLLHLAQWGQRLTRFKTRRERIESLCQLMTGEAVGASGAVAIRIVGKALEAVCTPVEANRSTSAATDEAWTWTSPTARVIEAVRKTAQPVLWRDPDRPRAIIVAPIRIEADSLEALYIELPGELETVQWLAWVSLATEQFQRAELNHLSGELERARRVQRQLVPRDVCFEGMDIAVHFNPSYQVGGDWADVLRLADGRVLLLLADVTGKGMGAALIAAGVRSAVHADVASGASMMEMIARLDAHLQRSLDDGMFVTLAAVAIDPKSGEIQCINAGHPPVVLIDDSGNVRYLQSGMNIPLGIEPTDLRAQNARLEANESLAIFSDGLIDLIDPITGSSIGIDNVVERLVAAHQEAKRAAGAGSAPSIAAWEQQVQLGFAGLRATDDQTMILARRRL